MCILQIDELRVLNEARTYPENTERQIRNAKAIIEKAKRTGRLDACIGGSDRFVRLTEALWDYFRDRELIG